MTRDKALSRSTVFVLPVLVMTLVGCGPDLPKECGQNVKRVTSMDFSGASVIPSDPGYAGYDVTVAVEKNDDSMSARVCYAVRDVDSWIKFFWAVDDVLDFYFMDLPGRQNTRTLPGQFLLEIRDDEVCGAGALAGADKVRGCSDESEAEVYMEPMGSSGSTSPTHVIRVQ